MSKSDTNKPVTQALPLPAELVRDIMPAITEMYKEWCRLEGYSSGKTPIETIIDTATGYEKARMEEFVVWFYLEVMSRLPPRSASDQDTTKEGIS